MLVGGDSSYFFIRLPNILTANLPIFSGLNKLPKPIEPQILPKMATPMALQLKKGDTTYIMTAHITAKINITKKKELAKYS